MSITTTGTRGATTAAELLAVLDDVAARLASLPVSSPVDGTQGAWVEVVRATQRLVNCASAVQDEAIVRLAAIELVEDDDGTIAQVHKTPGHVALDASVLVSFALEVSAVHAERRVRTAVRLAADGPAGTTTCTGLGALHDAMRSGSLDHYRAGIVAAELEDAPPEIAETVIATLGDHLRRETGPELRRRCRRILARISPDLLRQRATRARSECSLRRWVAEPGVDQWDATFPSEDAARAWAAIDARAQQLVADGVHGRIERARAQALIDLVTDHSTITTLVTIAVPDGDPRLQVAAAPVPLPTEPEASPVAVTSATAVSAGAADRATPSTEAPSGRGAGELSTAPASTRTGDLVEVANPFGGEPMLVSRAWLDALIAAPTTTVRYAPAHPGTGALRSTVTTQGYRPPQALAQRVRQRDGRCRFPGCHVAARFCDLDHVRPWPLGATADHNLISLCRRHHRIKQRLRWRALLHPDGTVTWTDPTGRQRTTTPVDALHGVMLPGTPMSASTTMSTTGTTIATPDADDVPARAPLTTSSRRRDQSTDQHSDVEFALEHLAGSSLPTRRSRRSRDRFTVDLVVAGLPVDATRRPCLRTTRPSRYNDPDVPPF